MKKEKEKNLTMLLNENIINPTPTLGLKEDSARWYRWYYRLSSDLEKKYKKPSSKKRNGLNRKITTYINKLDFNKLKDSSIEGNKYFFVIYLTFKNNLRIKITKTNIYFYYFDM